MNSNLKDQCLLLAFFHYFNLHYPKMFNAILVICFILKIHQISWNDENLTTAQATAIINVEKMRETAIMTVIAKPT